ncbi:MAG TPA: hypothetical protein VFZ53_01685 [Polyangiaceae bacterium]
MSSPEPDFDPFLDALRADFPSRGDERRLKQRLLAAGVGVTTGVVAPGAAAAGLAGVSSLPGVVLQKFGALSWVTKVGLAGVAAAVAAPAVYVASTPTPQAVEALSPNPHPRAAVRATSPRPVATVLAPERSEPSEDERVAPLSPARPAPAPPVVMPAARELVELPRRVAGASSASFPVDEDDGVRPPSSLAEETVLVERALYALRQGDRDGARRALAEHARRFPSGLLARERDRALERTNASLDAKSSASSPVNDSLEPARN